MTGVMLRQTSSICMLISLSPMAGTNIGGSLAVASCRLQWQYRQLNVNIANIMHQLRLLLLEGCYAGSVTGFIDLLHFANQIAATKAGQTIRLALFSLDGQAVTTASGIVLTRRRPELADAADTLVLPPISYRRLSDYETRLMQNRPQAHWRHACMQQAAV
jgi:hypothetical protein